jgi:hypothetical protein
MHKKLFIGVAVSAALGVAAVGCGNQPSQPVQAPPAPQQAAPAAPPQQTTQSPAPKQQSAPSTYSGNGSKSYSTINVPSDSVLYWQASGEAGTQFFSLIAEGGSSPVFITSQATSGQSDIPAGTYHNVQVSGVGDWSFRIAPK